jgi:flagellar hook-basal body complex protein FliE
MKITSADTPYLALKKTVTGPDTRPGFKESLEESMQKVNELQENAHSAMDDLAIGKSNNLHETMIAIQKAELSFKMMMQVKNKIVSAYQEVMRMQV